MNIHINSPIGGTGYGVASLNILKGLSQLPETHVALSVIGNPHLDNTKDIEYVQEALNNSVSVDYKAATLKIWHQFDLLNRPGKGKYFALPFYEVDTLDEREKHHLGFPDHLIVPSKWAKGVLKENGIKKRATVVPMGVDSMVFSPQEVTIDKPNYIFFNSRKMGSKKRT